MIHGHIGQMSHSPSCRPCQFITNSGSMESSTRAVDPCRSFDSSVDSHGNHVFFFFSERTDSVIGVLSFNSVFQLE